MKKKNFVLMIAVSALLLTSVNINVNAQKFEKGNIDANLMFGGITFWGTGYHMSMPLISISGDYGLKDDWGPGVFGVGAYLGIASYKYKYTSDYGFKYTEIVFAPRATYHYQFIKKLDTYGGVSIGIRIQRGKEYGTYYGLGGYAPTASSSVFGLGSIFVGAKYYFTNNFAAMGEVGFGTALLNIGVSWKFGK
jgi:hypothetical protein